MAINGQTKVAAEWAHRVGIWVSVIGMGLYVFNMGQWVGAADEKFEDAATVETTQRTLLLQVNTIATKQEAQDKAIAENKKAIEDSKKEILKAIEDLKDE